MGNIISIDSLTKQYDSGFKALDEVSLDIREGEIIALLGPNGAGKTTLISTVCGIVRASSGSVTVGGFDIQRQYKDARRLIGLVPQELTTDAFESVWATLRFSRGLFGKAPDDAHLEKVLRSLSLWEKKDNRIMTLSGGMKRRVLIAKALAHEPRVLFLDEPTAGVDVELRKDMWNVVRQLKAAGVTIILTTHYIEEAEEMADRVAVISKGRILLVDEKHSLMKKMGEKRLTLHLNEALAAIPDTLSGYGLQLADEGKALIYKYDTTREQTGITELLDAVESAGIVFADLETRQSTLEQIFVKLVK